MTDRADYEKRATIREDKGLYVLYWDEDIHDSFTNLDEANDELQDLVDTNLAEDHYYKCDFCQVYFQKDEPEHRIEDDLFTAPYGSTFVMGGDVSSVPVCPVCREDLERV